MNMKTTALAAAMAAVLGAGASGDALATEYAISRLYIDNLNVVLSDDGGTTPGTGGAVTNFNFNLINTAFLNTVGGASNATCSGTTSTNNCSGVAPVLNATVVNAPGSTILQGENTFTQNGPGVGSYSNGDSVILTSELVTGGSSSTRQIAEAEIQGGDSSASSSSEVSSTTGFTFTFTIAGANQMAINMDALLTILAFINDPTATAASATAVTEVEFKLSNNTTGAFATFRPDGAGLNECQALGGVTCLATADEFDLNTDVSVTGLPASSSGRSNTAANDAFGVIFGGLTDGTWTLNLAAKTSTALSRTVPEPSVLALLGIGLVGFGVTRRRKNRV